VGGGDADAALVRCLASRLAHDGAEAEARCRMQLTSET